MESRNASLFEYVFPCKSKEEPSSSKRVLETIHENSQDQDGEVEPRRNKRVRTKKSFGPDFLTYVLEKEPQTFKEATLHIVSCGKRSFRVRLIPYYKTIPRNTWIFQHVVNL